MPVRAPWIDEERMAKNGGFSGMVQITRFAGSNALSPFAQRKTMNPAGIDASVPRL
jgi:hypothetical protein